MSDQEQGTCCICGNTGALQRTYYKYPIKCDCCNGPEDDHFEICFHCTTCTPAPPQPVKCFIQPIKESS